MYHQLKLAGGREGQQGYHAIFKAVDNGDVQFITAMMSRVKSSSWGWESLVDDKGHNLLQRAIIARQPDIVKVILLNSDKLELVHSDCHGKFPLDNAITSGDVDILLTLASFYQAQGMTKEATSANNYVRLLEKNKVTIR